ncbi:MULTISPECIES: SDR family oxidoreductase [Anaerolinea]|uniref:SDR family oxidoreductase n=1 Tax=Anaerolinea TaxID=233189 RepID=UPI0026351F08|nr:SDR family oxidoreductase [Anaerolinea thermophila]
METTDLTGKTILITGATDGIGRETARQLARLGAHIILTGRNPQKAEAAVQELRQSTGNPHIEFLIADLSSQRQIRALAETVKGKISSLYALINNAGAIFMQRQVSEDGIEMTFALNHLGYFSLTLLLLDVLKGSAPARIINVSSAAHRGARLDFEDLQNERSYQGWRVYSQSKLANLLFTYELARRLEGSGITVNALHPGFVATRFGRSNGGIFDPLFRLFQFAAISPEEGARTSVYLAASQEVEGVSGKYFEKCRAVPSSPESYDLASARRLWEISLQMTGLSEPEILRSPAAESPA